MDIKYTKATEHGYKYELTETYKVRVPIKEGDVLSDYVRIKPRGFMIIKAGYAWDGPSGPTIDTLNFMRGSLVHDALYQLIREGKLDTKYRKVADKLLRDICREDGMSKLRSTIVYWAVRIFGGLCI